MKKNIYKIGIITLFGMLSTFGIAQNSYVKKTNSLKEKMAYVEDIKTYEKLLSKGNKDNEIISNLSKAYYENGMYLEANRWYSVLFEYVKVPEDITDINAFYEYVQTIRTTGDYVLANAKMDLLADKAPEDGRVKKYLSDPNYLEEVNTNSDGYRVKLLGNVNTAGSEYGAALYKGEIVYASSVNKKGKQKGKHSWTNDPYTKLYSAPVRIDGNIGEVKPFAKKIDGNFNEANAIFTADSRTMYFSSNNREDKNVRYSDGTLLVSLYRAYSFGNGLWGDVEKLSINLDNANTASPALSPDQDWLYFSSDRPGGYGQSDLYRVRLFRDGTLGTPENLGNKINTEGRESFPFVSTDNVLYFASDGHPGLGGLDLYGVQIYDDGSFGEVVNLGNSINSPYDDFAMYLDPEAKFGFITSNRPNGNGKDDLYFVRMKEGTELNISQEIRGRVTDKTTKRPILDAFVFLYDSKHRMIEEIEVDKRGEYSFKDVKVNRDYYVAVKAKGYKSEEVSVEDVNKDDSIEVDFELERSKPFSSRNYPTYDDEEEYDEDYYGEPRGKNRGNPRIGDDLGKLTDLAPIYFNNDSSVIRSDAQLELSKVSSIMMTNPSLKLEVRSYTSSVGPDEYNLRLSERRADQTVDWLVRQGVNRLRLRGVGYGEKGIINRCKNNVPCSEREHQENRRSEFIIIDL
ncbi:PD40 domain-containing protein [Myroides odoratimimus]|uniref:OmpA family protein n=1 Tax=Myroides odoratimimus TaxID=76832 RepID=UPI002574B990|nr:OmpA family protein [Myroides odoratimimus]MDM1396534.1 PD40 domain-containing protein [Myroides odoratimimus]